MASSPCSTLRLLPCRREIWGAYHTNMPALPQPWLTSPCSLWAFPLLLLSSGNLFAISLLLCLLLFTLQILSHRSLPLESSYQTILFVMQIKSAQYFSFAVSTTYLCTVCVCPVAVSCVRQAGGIAYCISEGWCVACKRYSTNRC